MGKMEGLCSSHKPMEQDAGEKSSRKKVKGSGSSSHKPKEQDAGEESSTKKVKGPGKLRGAVCKMLRCQVADEECHAGY